ncbi:MAG: fibronectin type III domain-containing protein, partial [Candidatus Krumholzibacteria bacterium]|nr:fibronectin type III domain-containing protein [Candidatus Krumholzibacteria bacterium]
MKNITLIISVAALVVVTLLISACGDDSPPMGPTGGGNAMVPAAPSDLVASQRSQSTVLLNWQDNSDDETGFRIERSLSPASGFTQVAGVGKDASSFTATGLNTATTYYFRVCAYNSAGNSSYTIEVKATTLDATGTTPSAPSNLQASQPSHSSIHLNWQHVSSNATGFKVELSLFPSGGFAGIASVGAGITAITISNLNASTTYYFRVYAYNAAGNSAYSNTANATTLSDPAPATAPVLTGPSSAVTDGQHFRLDWTYDWGSCTFCPGTDGYRLEESSTSSTSGFTTLWESYLTADRESPKSLVITPRSADTYWYRVRAHDGGWSDYSNVVQVTVEALVSSTRFVNNTSYIIVS